MCSPSLAVGVVSALSAAYGAYASSQVKPPTIPQQPQFQPQEAPRPPGAVTKGQDARRVAALMGATQGGTSVPGSLFSGGTIGG